jgi:hypothetical protein
MRAMLQAVSYTGRLPGRTRRPVRAYDPALGEAAMIIAHARQRVVAASALCQG